MQTTRPNTPYPGQIVTCEHGRMYLRCQIPVATAAAEITCWILRDLLCMYLAATCSNHRFFTGNYPLLNQPERPRNARAGEEAANTIRVNKTSGKESNVRGTTNRSAALHTSYSLELGKQHRLDPSMYYYPYPVARSQLPYIECDLCRHLWACLLICLFV